jgi:hypothetical protein
MAGVLGLTFRAGELDENDELAMSEQVSLYKEVASVLRRAAGVLLTPQAVNGGAAWDALQAVTVGGDAVLFAFQTDPGANRVTLRLRGLRSSATYLVESADAGPLGTATGATLMTDGIELNAGAASTAHVVFVRRARSGA